MVAIMAALLYRISRRVDLVEVNRYEPPKTNVGFMVTVGGKDVQIKALSGKDFGTAFQELPELLFAYASESVVSEDGPDFDRVVATAKRWINACATRGVGQEEWDLFTYPEAQAAIATISEVNGISENLATFFRQQRQSERRWYSGMADALKAFRVRRFRPTKPAGPNV